MKAIRMMGASVALAACTLNAHAATSTSGKQDGHELIGVGRWSCAEMMSNPRAMARAFDWLDGMLSAYNGEHAASITAGLDKDEQQLDLAAQCRMDPDQHVGIAAVRVLGELVTKYRARHHS